MNLNKQENWAGYLATKIAEEVWRCLGTIRTIMEDRMHPMSLDGLEKAMKFLSQ